MRFKTSPLLFSFPLVLMEASYLFIYFLPWCAELISQQRDRCQLAPRCLCFIYVFSSRSCESLQRGGPRAKTAPRPRSKQGDLARPASVLTYRPRFSSALVRKMLNEAPI